MKRSPLRRASPLQRAGMSRSSGKPRAQGKRSAYRARERHVDYMLAVKRMPCLMRDVWGHCEGPVEADHAGRRGLSHKAHDNTVIPLCRLHHAQRFPTFIPQWTHDVCRAWLDAAVHYTQALARSRGVLVPVDEDAPQAEQVMGLMDAWQGLRRCTPGTR